MIRCFLSLILFFFLTIPLASCGQNHLATSSPKENRNVLKVGITTNAPPLAYREQEKVTGLEA